MFSLFIILMLLSGQYVTCSFSPILELTIFVHVCCQQETSSALQNVCGSPVGHSPVTKCESTSWNQKTRCWSLHCGVKPGIPILRGLVHQVKDTCYGPTGGEGRVKICIDKSCEIHFLYQWGWRIVWWLFSDLPIHRFPPIILWNGNPWIVRNTCTKRMLACFILKIYPTILLDQSVWPYRGSSLIFDMVDPKTLPTGGNQSKLVFHHVITVKHI